MKVFFGNNDVASIISDIKPVFKKMGVDMITVTDRTPSVGDKANVDYNFSNHVKRMFTPVRPLWLRDKLREWQHIDKRVWRKATKECDLFIFKWSSFKEDYSDWEELKQMGKKLVVCYCGDDVRWHYAAKQEFEMYGFTPIQYDDNYDYSAVGLEKRLRRIRMGEKYADWIFSRLDQAQLQLRPYYRYNMMVDANLINHRPQQRKIPVVVHAPTSRKIKGTETVLSTFKKLKEEGLQFDIQLIENMAPNEAVKVYENADIVIDQLIIPGTGRLSTEALAAGKVVMSHMAYDTYPQKNPSDCPIVDVNSKNLHLKLTQLIPDQVVRQSLADRGRSYVDKYLDLKVFAQKVIDLYSGKKIPLDYSPDFFQNSFVPEESSRVELYNKWTYFVSDCDWYKSNIKPGERSGLKF